MLAQPSPIALPQTTTTDWTNNTRTPLASSSLSHRRKTRHRYFQTDDDGSRDTEIWRCRKRRRGRAACVRAPWWMHASRCQGKQAAAANGGCRWQQRAGSGGALLKCHNRWLLLLAQQQRSWTRQKPGCGHGIARLGWVEALLLVRKEPRSRPPALPTGLQALLSRLNQNIT